MATYVADGAFLTNISEMIDLAIGTPEVGVVDFCMLQTVLHCLAQQLRVLGKNVELRGGLGVVPAARSSENSQTIAISEFIVDTGIPGKYELATEAPSPNQESMLVVERRRRTAPQPVLVMTGDNSAQQPGSLKSDGRASAPTPLATVLNPPTTTPTSTMTAPTSSATAPTPTPSVTVPMASPVPPSTIHGSRTTAASGSVPSAEKLSLVTLSKFNMLENTVVDLKNRVYGTSPKNEDILQEVRSQGNLKAITDMWTNMNVASRLDAAEAGISKLSSLIEDLIGETADIQKKIGSEPSAVTAKMVKEANELSKTGPTPVAPVSTPSGQGLQATPSAPSQAASTQATPTHTVPSQAAPIQAAPSLEAIGRFIEKDFATKDELRQLLGHLQNMKNDLDEITKTFSDAMTQVNPDFVAAEPHPPSKLELKVPEVSVVIPPVPPQVSGRAPISFAAAPAFEPSHTQVNQLEARLLERLALLEKELKKCCDSTKKSDGLVQDQLNSYQDQLEYMATQIAGLTVKSEVGKLSPDLVKDLQGLMKLFETVHNMQAQLQQVHETALSLAAEKEGRQDHIDALLEQIELLKVIKLDREDMVEALADKADLHMLARKVSHDQFENACDDLSKGLEHAFGKLNVQESLWQQALDDIQREIEQKLDKMELSPVKEFFNKKLKQLQESLKQMALLRREAEAAGTKRRLLREVNCISCDAKAVMAMDPLPPQPPKPLPATLSMKPYLSYELDTIRKTQASSLPQRNMHDWEHVQQQMQPKPHKVRSDTDKHLCNRYCGGSHTVTTPAQRVARLGHFIKQWGPEVLPLSSGFAAGDDGRLYKISTSEGANVGPGMTWHAEIRLKDVTVHQARNSVTRGAVEGAAVCTPKSPSKKSEHPKSPKPIYISAECRCLDPTAEPPPPKN